MRLVGLVELNKEQEDKLKRRLQLGYKVVRVWMTGSGYVRVNLLNKSTNAVKSLYWYKDSWRIAT